jgi:amidase
MQRGDFDMNRVTKDQLCTSFSALNPPALRVQPGETFVMETNDRFAVYEGPDSSPEAMEILKTMAGPVYIEGARPGDTLKIDVLDVTTPLDYGWIGATPGRGPLGQRIPAFRKTRVQITPDGVIFNGKIKLPSRPMIGRIGLAPQDGPLPSIAKGNFGGGMGNTQIGKGATVYLPVFHDGGLLTIGDCHAAMGDGEATASAVECAVDATLRVTIEERFKVNRPVVETGDEVMTTGEGSTMEEATHVAIAAMADLLMDQLGLDDTDAAMLIASAADVRTGIAGHAPYTMRVAVPKSMLSW